MRLQPLTLAAMTTGPGWYLGTDNSTGAFARTSAQQGRWANGCVSETGNAVMGLGKPEWRGADEPEG
jgi:hypothetical protein